MPKEIKKEFRSLIKGALASTGPPLGPACGKFVSNLKEMVALINEKTLAYKGLSVYIKIIIYTDRSYQVSLDSIPLSTRIKQYSLDKKIKKTDIAKIASETYGSTDAKTMEGYIKEETGTVSSHKIKII